MLQILAVQTIGIQEGRSRFFRGLPFWSPGRTLIMYITFYRKPDVTRESLRRYAICV